MSDVVDLSIPKPRDDLALAQVVELYRGGYVTMKIAKALAWQYAGEKAELVNWHSLRRDRRAIG